MLSFMTALYNEEKEVEDLLDSVSAFVDDYYICDDGSTDTTASLIKQWSRAVNKPLLLESIPHVGRPETVKARALSLVPYDRWILMLDADERIDDRTLVLIRDWVDSEESMGITHVWFTLEEYIDGTRMKTFQKCRLFRKEAAHFSTGIHEDDRFDGQGAFFEWKVIHRKTSAKQIEREIQYLSMYRKMLNNGEIDNDRYHWLISNHYFVRPHG